MFDKIKELIRKYPNDMDLGIAIRKLNTELIDSGKGEEFLLLHTDEYTNDMDLGKQIRHNYNEYISIYHDVV